MPQDVTVRNLYAGKNLQIIGGVLVILGVIGMVSGGGGTASTVALVVTVIGFVVFIIGRFKHWYHAE